MEIRMISPIEMHKGPWQKGQGLSDVILNNKGDYICTVWGRTNEEIKRHSALITTAPLMHQALEELAEYLRGKELDQEGRALLGAILDVSREASGV